MKGEDITVLFEDMDDPEEEAKKVRLRIFQLVRVYTKALESVKTDDLRNHMSYWLLLTSLIEKQMIEEIDQEYLEYMEENGSSLAATQPEEPFFLFEGSLKLLCRYLKKLSIWY